MSVFTGAQVAAVLIFLLLPIQQLSSLLPSVPYARLLIFLKPELITQKLAPYKDQYHWTTGGYTLASILSYSAGKSFSVFGKGSKFGRQDDSITDFRKLDSKNLLFFSESPPNEADFKPYFSEVKTENISVLKAKYFVLLGTSFHFSRYRDELLLGIKDDYYKAPDWLPLGGCSFLDRYFPKLPKKSSF
jgi:hypothetical protein